MCIFCVCSNAHECRFSWRPQEGVGFPRAALRGRVHSCLWAQTGQLWAARVRTGNLIWSSAIVTRFLAAGPASVFNRFSRQHWVFCVLWIMFCKVWHVWQSSYSCTFLILGLLHWPEPPRWSWTDEIEVSDIYFPSFISKREISMLTITFDKWKPFLEDTAFWRINAFFYQSVIISFCFDFSQSFDIMSRNWTLSNGISRVS